MDFNDWKPVTEEVKTTLPCPEALRSGYESWLKWKADSKFADIRVETSIRDRTVSIDSSNGRFGSDFRLEVTCEGSSHFVFLEADQLQWLEGLLSAAESSKWMLPESCRTRSSRRNIAVCSFVVKGVSMLKVVEECASGQVFFVLIPADSHRGWSSFVRKLRELLGIVSTKSLVSVGRSFASVVAGSPFPVTGRCVKSRLEGEEVLVVEEEGVQARRDFLSKCLVMRFVGDSPFRWDEFRGWMTKAWGIPMESVFLPIGDDLWMLPVSSKSIASRIMALKRWKFKTWDIFMDLWTEAAGRSKCLEAANEAWVVARGIPLHLRSMELFRQIGEFCGGFIGAEDGVSLSTIRIKIKRGALIPDEIPVCFKEEVFPVRIEVEAPSPLSLHGPKSTFFRKWKSKGSGMRLSTQSVEPEKLAGDHLPSSSGVGGLAKGHRSSKGMVGGPKKSREEVCIAGGVGMGEEGRPRTGLQESDDLTDEEDTVYEVLAAVLCTSKDMPVDDLAPDPSTLSDEERDKTKDSGLGQKLLDGPQLDSQPNVELCVVPKSPKGPANIQEPKTKTPELIASNGAAPRIVPTQIEPMLQSASQELTVIDDTPNPHLEISGRGDGELAGEDRGREEELSLKVKEVASDIGLEMDGSRLEGVRAAARVCKEVMKRKPARTPGSKTEREHKRLGISGDPRSSTPLPPRRERSVPPSQSSNEL
ncbi:hypothetical protein LINPERHAP1_LOCUS38294 [Linum perenne]